jgi:apolipoprotein N-acyltransferase
MNDLILFKSPIIRLATAFIAGAVTVFSFAPFDLSPLAIVAPAVLLLLWLGSDRRMAFVTGLAFGLGLFGIGVFWMHISIDQFGNVGTPLAIFITLAFITAMALYYGLLGWLGKRLAGSASHLQQLVVYLLLWVLLEWLRGWVLTGFPWLDLGYSQIGTALQGYAPLLGVYGVSLAVMVSAACLAAVASSFRRLLPALLVLSLVWGGGWLLTQEDWTTPSGAALKVSIIQGNVEQAIKWSPEARQPTIDLYLRLTRQEWASDIVVWPETALPALYHQLDKGLFHDLELEAQKNHSDLLFGIAVWEDTDQRYYNSMTTLGSLRNFYYKRHLVPFGEFMPLRILLQPLIEYLQIPMSNFSAGKAERPLLKVAGHWAGVSICYEDAFGDEIIQAMPDAEFLVNASNDAWFGDSLALPQHLQIARMRSIETGRYQLRATNTGISAFIGPKGELISASPIFRQYVLRGEIIPMTGMTPYALVGNWGVVLLVSLPLVLLGIKLRGAVDTF